MKEIAWRWHEFALSIQTYEEYLGFAENTMKEAKEDNGLTHTPEDLLEFRFLGFILHETEGKEVSKEEEDKEGKEEKKQSCFTPPPSLVLALESLGFADGDKKVVREEKKEQEREKKQEEDDDDDYVLIQRPEDELELDLLDFIFLEV